MPSTRVPPPSTTITGSSRSPADRIVSSYRPKRSTPTSLDRRDLSPNLSPGGLGLGGTGRTRRYWTDSVGLHGLPAGTARTPGRVAGLGGTRRYQTDGGGCQVAHNPKVVGSNPTPATIASSHEAPLRRGLTGCLRLLPARGAEYSTSRTREVRRVGDQVDASRGQGRPARVRSGVRAR